MFKNLYSRIKNRIIKISPEILYITLAIPFGLSLAIITPPMFTPDEQAHYWRIYQISEGNLLADKKGEDYGGELPTSLLDLFMITREYKPFESTNSIDFDLGNLIEIYKEPLNVDQKSFIVFNNSAVYTPVPYIPQSIGVFIGRVLELSPALIMLFGRITNLLVACLLTFYAIKKIPVLKWTLVLIALFPMVVAQYSSLSADALTISIIFVYISLILDITIKSMQNPFIIPYRELISIVIIGLILSLSKQSYFIILFLIYLLPVSGFKFRWKGYLFYTSIFLVLTILPSLLWNQFAKDYLNYGDPNYLNNRISYILNKPFDYAYLLVFDFYKTNGFYYFDSAFGRLGWINIFMSFLFHTIPYYVLTILSALVNWKHTINFKTKIFLSLIITANVSFIATMLFLTWSRTFTSLDGIQGRYLIPFLLLFALMLSNKNFHYINKNNNYKLYLLLFLIYSSISTVINVWFIFYK